MPYTVYLRGFLPQSCTEFLFTLHYMKHIFLITTLLLSLSLFAQKKQPYVLYDAKGKKLSYEKMLKRLTDKDVLLFGEYHNNAIAH